MQQENQASVSIPSGQIFEKIAKISVYLAVLLLPIFFLPWTVSVLDFNKQALLIFFIFIALIFWVISIFVGKKLDLNFHLLSIPVLMLLTVAGLSTIFSYWRYGSFWGWPVEAGESFISLLSLILLFFLIINIFRKKKDVFGLLIALAVSSVIAALFGIFQIFGKFFLPFDFAKTVSFNTISTLNGFGVFLAGLLPLLIVLIILSKRFLKVIFGAGLVICLTVLFLIGFKVAWWMVIVEMISLFILLISRRKVESSRLAVPVLLILAIAVLFGVLKISLIPAIALNTLEVSPSQGASFNVAAKILAERPILGSGPGTFIYDYARFKSEELNQTNFWNIDFGNSASKMINALATLGILGILAMLLIIAGMGYYGYIFIIQGDNEDPAFSVLTLGVLASWLGLTVGSFLYPSSLTVEFFWWIMAAGFIALSSQKIKSFELKSSSQSTLAVSLALMLVFLFGIGILFLEGQKYLANVRYFQGILSLNQGKTDEAIAKVLSAVNLDSKTDVYQKSLSQIYSVRLNEEIQRKDIPQDQINQNSQILINNAVNYAKAATELNPKNFANWLARGKTYQDLIGITAGAEDWAIKSYEEAEKLQPANPVIPTQKGITYIGKAIILSRAGGKETETNEALKQALEEFKKAIALKSDYAPAHFQAAVVYQLEGKVAEVITKLEETKVAAPFDVGLAFQLGVIYYQNGNYDKAKGEFQRAVLMNPDYSNARYFLGLIYDREKNKTLAIEQFQKIEALNPGNQEVEKILANLKAGDPALKGIVPAVPPATPIPEGKP